MITMLFVIIPSNAFSLIVQSRSQVIELVNLKYKFIAISIGIYQFFLIFYNPFLFFDQIKVESYKRKLFIIKLFFDENYKF